MYKIEVFMRYISHCGLLDCLPDYTVSQNVKSFKIKQDQFQISSLNIPGRSIYEVVSTSLEELFDATNDLPSACEWMLHEMFRVVHTTACSRDFTSSGEKSRDKV